MRTPLAEWTSALALMAAIACAPTTSPGAESPWPSDVPGFTWAQPGEHPRLLFRKGDLPELRKRVETPEGKAILQRLRFLLDGANGDTPPRKAAGGERELGAFTIGHAAGYGLLYQLTGEKKYADLGLQCFDRMIAGERDRDTRYSFVAPNGELRSGSSWAIAALGYDLCHDGFTPADRVRIARAFLTTKGQQDHNLEKVVRKPKYRPSKNHTGGILCGAVAAAAIYDDPGTEGAKIREEWLPDAYRNTLAMLTQGFGDHGWYAESQGPSHVSSDTGLLVWLKAARVACGKDFVSARPNAQYLTLRWAMEIIPQEGRPQYPLRMAAGPSYGTHELRPGERTFDATTSPWRAVMAFLNWPIGIEPKNPEGILPKAISVRSSSGGCASALSSVSSRRRGRASSRPSPTAPARSVPAASISAWTSRGPPALRC